eukprot:gene24840-10492_t
MPSHWEKQMNSSPMGKKRVLVPYLALLEGTNALESAMIALSDAELAAKTVDVKDRLAFGTAWASLLQGILAWCGRPPRRVLKHETLAFIMVEAIVLHNGPDCEMATARGRRGGHAAATQRPSGKGVPHRTVHDY